MNEIYNNRDLTTLSGISVFQLVNILPDAVFVCDNTGHILVCSDEALRFFKLSDKTRIIGSSFQSYVAYESIDEAVFMLSVAVNEANSRKTGKFLVKKGLKETCYADIKFTSIVIDEIPGKFVLVTFREIPTPEPGIEIFHRKDGRLARLCETVVSSPGQALERTQKLLSQIGETLGAVSCAFNKLEKGELHSVASWESPFNTSISTQLGAKQLFDYLTDKQERHTLVKKPLLTTFLESELHYNDDSGVKALLGITVGANNAVSGILTAVFTFGYSLTDLDLQFLQTVSAILENENWADNQSGKSADLSFRHLIDCFADPVFILSSEGIIEDVNNDVVKTYGYSHDEFIGQTLVRFSVEAKNDIGQMQLMTLKAFDGEPQRFEWWSLNKNGDVIPSEVIFTKSEYAGHDVLYAISRDLSKSKKIEEELTRNNIDLKESNSSKDKFLSILAHDLKNPFQGLLGFVDLLCEDLDDLSSDEIKEYLANVRNASYHIYDHLENLLAWSRIQSGKMPFSPTSFDIREAIQAVISVLENNATQKGIKLFNEVDANIIVEADRNMIHSVMQNLIANAIKFSNNKGRVVVRCRVPQTFIKSGNTDNQVARQFLEVSVSDNGIGIPKEIMPNLFKLNGQFTQAGTANEPGSGLGLIICHEMVQKNGGKIWVESIEGQGTTFIFTLPLST